MSVSWIYGFIDVATSTFGGVQKRSGRRPAIIVSASEWNRIFGFVLHAEMAGSSLWVG